MLSLYMESGSSHVVCEVTIRCAGVLFVHHDFLFSLMPVTGRIVSNEQQKVQRLHSYTRTDGPAYGRLEVSLKERLPGLVYFCKKGMESGVG